MSFTKNQLSRMAEIVNEAISETEFSSFTVTSDDFDPIDNFFGGGLVKWADSNLNPVTKAFNETAQNRIADKGQFFHFKSTRIALDIISNRCIQVSNLLSNDKNDFSEYSEFFKRLGLFHKLIPNDYCQQLNTKHFNPASKSQMDELRDNIMILCFTKEAHNEKFWKCYAKNDTGVCISFRFLNFDQNKLLYFDFRDVCYDDGYRFDFINHINYHFRKEFDRQLVVEGITKFSKFYKRGKYDWENEARLCFHYDFTSSSKLGDYLSKNFPIEKEPGTNRKYIKLPLKGNDIQNPLFTLTVDEVICGKNVSATCFENLYAALTENFPDATIWQRK
jgi:hypothetical protein